MRGMNDLVMQKNPSQVAPSKKSSSSESLLLYAIVAIGLALVIRFFIAAPYVVSGASMDPTFHDWHYLIIDRVSYKLGDPERGDVVVFDLPSNTSRSLIKRVIGLPGETVIINGNSVTIQNDENPAGFVLDEPYLDAKNLGGISEMQMTLAANEYFVLGDNRKVSADSRIWGTLPREDIVGRAFLRLYPFDSVGVLPGEARYEE